MTEDYKKIGKRIDDIRRERGFTKTELADKIGVTPMVVSNHTNGATGMTLHGLIRYAGALGCTINDILDDTIDPTEFKIDTDLTARWPFNFLFDIYVDDSEKAFNVNISKFLSNYASQLSKKEADVVQMRYLNNMTFDAIGKALGGYSASWTRQVALGAMQKLKSSKFNKSWMMFDQSMVENLVECCRNLSKEVDSLKLYLAEAELKVPISYDKYRLPIDCLKLSTRASNALIRAGIETLGDLSHKTFYEIHDLDNIGPITAIEIESKAKDMGVILRRR